MGAWFVSSLLARISLGTAAVAVLWSVLLIPFGWTSAVVVSGSMMPEIRAGDVAIASPIDPADVRPGQPILVDNPAKPGRLLLHRVVRRNPDGSFVTRGDANRVDDSLPVPPGSVRGLPRLLVRYVGLPVYWHARGDYRHLTVTAGLLVTLGLLAAKRPDEDGDAGLHRAGGGHARWRPGRPAARHVRRA
ncbi:signal peptidase I [Actinoplanes oblitus]|uniref:Signal peptidase I n=1 Tax=Actinoplanes oblitus TaxID=3040509 RepID=A0ABY8WA38_9ACTN|nr:signal peptidase I [Actinoplanes oblitus]WIM93785.1 signal peptidase I [Actinoplanes oblitus]